MTSKKKFLTRFWLITYLDEDDCEKQRLAQGPKSYSVGKVKKYLKMCCHDMKITKIKRVSRPEWSVIFEDRKNG